MAGNTKTSIRELFSKISAYSIAQELGDYLNKLSTSDKEYASSLDLILDILRSLNFSEERLVSEILEIVTGDVNVGAMIENGYHGAINSLEAKLSEIETKQNDDSFINKLEDAVKVTISSILTGLLSCSVEPYIPYINLDKVYKKRESEEITPYPIMIPTNILDFSKTLQVSPVSESGIYFYNTGTKTTYYERKGEPTVETSEIVAGIKDPNAEKTVTYSYKPVSLDTITDEDKKKFKKVVSVPSEVKLKESDTPPEEFIYTIRPLITAEGLYKTDDMNAFIWYVANRGDNYDETDPDTHPEDIDIVYEYNKMAWDSRRMNKRVTNEARTTADEWEQWLKSRETWTWPEQGEQKSDDLFLIKTIDGVDKKIDSLYPILQFEPSELYGDTEHVLVSFPAQTYLKTQKIMGAEYDITKTIYKFNSDYLKSIKLFNWKTIIMNVLYELNGISPIPDIQHNISLSDEIIDARLSTLILNTIEADDKEVDDSYYSFTNDDYAAALKQMELKKYGAKQYETAGNPAIQNPSGIPLDTLNSIATSTTLNEVSSTIKRGVYAVAGSSGSTGITKTTLSVNLSVESNFVYQVLFAIVKPLVRAILSPQIMLLFCINLDTMGLINLKGIASGDIDLINDFIFRKLSGIIKKLIVQIKDLIVKYLLEIVRKTINKKIEEVAILLLLEQMDDYIRLLNQIMECIRKFGIGTTVSGIDEVTYADIIPEEKIPKNK